LQGGTEAPKINPPTTDKSSAFTILHPPKSVSGTATNVKTTYLSWMAMNAETAASSEWRIESGKWLGAGSNRRLEA
jgi:hypothetical protein